ncbi:MAG: hypothetical protein Q7S49_02625 [bacterium]|nr:hypothetical protein [bacterium]
MFVAFMVVMTVVGRTAPPEEPQEVLRACNGLIWLSKSLDKMAGEVLDLDEILDRNWTARLDDRLRLQREVNDLSREYMDAAGNYNRSMKEVGFRCVDPAKLPAGATSGPLPRRHEPFVLLKNGPRA